MFCRLLFGVSPTPLFWFRIWCQSRSELRDGSWGVLYPVQPEEEEVPGDLRALSSA